jgi:hypothetical protein
MPKKKTIDKNHNGVDDRLDTITNICAVILPFTTTDQLYKIYVEQKVEGVSAITWFLYGIFSFPLLAYAIKRKDFPMIVLNGLWVLVDFSVFAGVLMYA